MIYGMPNVRTRRPARAAHRPRVSIVVPLYNYGHFLGECIDSILTQDGVDVDVLVIDDASTDDSLTIAHAIAAADNRVRVVSNQPNIGMVATINDGLWSVEGDYVVKMDADDMLTPAALARATALLEAHPSVGFVYGFPVAFAESPPHHSRTKVRSWTVWSGHDWLEIRCRKGSNCIMQPEVVMRREALHAAGRYRPAMGHAPDFDMWLRLAAIADVGRINGADQGYYRLHPDSWQRTMSDFYLRDLEAARNAFTHLFDGPGSAFPDASILLMKARRAIAINAINRARRACDEGSAPDEPIDEYLALALDVWPDAFRLRQWHALERKRRIASGHTHAATMGRLVRDIEGRLRWRRWRWTGV